MIEVYDLIIDDLMPLGGSLVIFKDWWSSICGK